MDRKLAGITSYTAKSQQVLREHPNKHHKPWMPSVFGCSTQWYVWFFTKEHVKFDGNEAEILVRKPSFTAVVLSVL